MADQPLDADQPVKRTADDLLSRGPIVTQLATWVRRAPTSDGFVIGLTGPWGSGKSSVLHLLQREIEQEAAVVWFEPWLFSGADQLVVRFFDEVAAQLLGSKNGRRRFKKVARRMAGYGAALSPAASAVIGPAGQLIAAPERVAAAREKSAAGQREELRRELRATPQRIVVLIDDIDRLDPQETREVLRLVKLVADLPGVVHVLSYARLPVERALETVGIEDGRSYLEKIVQASLAVPPISKDRLRTMSLDWLSAAIPDGVIDEDAWDTSIWTQVLDGGIDAYLQTLRDGRRFANMAPAALELCNGEVADTDVLALEALRTFDPSVHEGLLPAARMLTGSRDTLDFVFRREESEAQAQRAAEVLLEGSTNRAAARTILRTLFPAAGHVLGGSRYSIDRSWLGEKRVASYAVLSRYLHFSLATDEAPSATVDRAIASLADAEAFRALLASVPTERLNDLLDRVRARVGEQDDVDALGCGLVLLDVVPRVPPRPGFFDVDPERKVIWLVESLVERLGAPPQRAEVARALVERAPSLSLRMSLLYRFRVPPDGPSKSPDLDLLDDAAFDELIREIADAVRNAPLEALLGEPKALWLITELGQVDGRESVIERLRHGPLLANMLTLTGTRVRPLTDGGVALHIEPLVELAGDDVLPLLAELQTSDLLDAQTAAALKRELDRWHKQRAGESDDPQAV